MGVPAFLCASLEVNTLLSGLWNACTPHATPLRHERGHHDDHLNLFIHYPTWYS